MKPVLAFILYTFQRLYGLKGATGCMSVWWRSNYTRAALVLEDTALCTHGIISLAELEAEPKQGQGFMAHKFLAKGRLTTRFEGVQ